MSMESSYAFCTIVTSNYLPFARVLQHSLRLNGIKNQFHVLVVDNIKINELQNQSNNSFKIWTVRDIEKGYQIDHHLINYHRNNNLDHFRWALKPVFTIFLLEHGHEYVFYTDPDIYFTGNPSFLINEFQSYSILLTPHWRNISNVDQDLFSLLKDGYFNAGFLGASKKGKAHLKWLETACKEKMEQNLTLGTFDDQKYLDILCLEFDDVKTIRHRGCNIANWNIHTNKRVRVKNKLLINSQYEPIFIHFTNDTIINVLNLNDELLKPHLEEYIRLLKIHGFNLLEKIDNFELDNHNTLFYKMKYKLRLRTRLKNLLLKLAKKI